MAKVLVSISRDSPASPLTVSTSNTFSFAGTPTLSGGGGAQRYDFKWEVNSGSGYVTIGAATGLTTANTNPIVNTNSQAQQSITVTCAQVGSYTIRMAGAPTSGGSYTVFSPTQTVTVELAAIAGTMAATEAGSDSASASGSVAVSGSISATESGSDTFAGTGSAASQAARTGALAAVESGGDTAAFSGMALLRGLLAASEAGSDAATLAGAVIVAGSMAVSEVGADNFSASGPPSGPPRKYRPLQTGTKRLGRL